MKRSASSEREMKISAISQVVIDVKAYFTIGSQVGFLETQRKEPQPTEKILFMRL